MACCKLNPFGVRRLAFGVGRRSAVGGRCLGPSVRDRWTGAFNRARARDLEGEAWAYGRMGVWAMRRIAQRFANLLSAICYL